MATSGEARKLKLDAGTISVVKQMSGLGLPAGHITDNQRIVLWDQFDSMRNGVYKGCFYDKRQAQLLSMHGFKITKGSAESIFSLHVEREDEFKTELLNRCRQLAWLRANYIHGFVVDKYPKHVGKAGWEGALFSRRVVQNKYTQAAPAYYVHVRPIYSVVVLSESLVKIDEKHRWWIHHPELGFKDMGLGAHDDYNEWPEHADFATILQRARRSARSIHASRANDEIHHVIKITDHAKMKEEVDRLQVVWAEQASHQNGHGFYFPSKGVPVILVPVDTKDGRVNPDSHLYDYPVHSSLHLPHTMNTTPHLRLVQSLPPGEDRQKVKWDYEPPEHIVQRDLMNCVLNGKTGPHRSMLISHVDHTVPRRIEGGNHMESVPHEVSYVEHKALAHDHHANQFSIVSSLSFKESQSKHFHGWIVDTTVELLSNEAWKHREPLTVTAKTYIDRPLEEIVPVVRNHYLQYSPWRDIEHGDRHFWLPKFAISYETDSKTLKYFGVYPRYLCLSQDQFQNFRAESERGHLEVNADQSSARLVHPLHFTPPQLLDDPEIMRSVGLPAETVTWIDPQKKLDDLHRWANDLNFSNVLVYDFRDESGGPVKDRGLSHHFHAPALQSGKARSTGGSCKVVVARGRVLPTAWRNDAKSFLYHQTTIPERFKQTARNVKQKVRPGKSS